MRELNVRNTKMKNIIIKKLLLVFAIQLIIVSFVFAQSSKKLIHDGNQKYEQKKYGEAEVDYRKSLSTKENPFVGNYNLGNAYYQQGKLDEAKQQYETASGLKSVSPEQLAKTYHNLGNSLIKSKKYEEGAQAYKQALKLNPKDNDTRYNLAYAQAMLQQQQKQKQNSDKNQDKNQDKDKKNQQKENKAKQEQKQEQKQDQAKKEEQPRKDKISKEDAEKILQALNNDEKKTQKKLSIKQASKVQIEKEW